MNSPVSAIEAIEKAMEGATPGEWVAHQTVIHGVAYGRHWVEVADHEQLIQISGSGGARSFTQRVFDTQGHDDNEANARYVAACNPVAMREVLSLARQAEALQQEVDSLKQTRQHSREASAALHDAFMEERKRVEALQRERSTAEMDVLAERRRQVEVEGWTAEHDDAHRRGELAGAAACYVVDGLPSVAKIAVHRSYWDWDSDWWKPSDHRRNLVKAAALIIAEIERLDRARALLGGENAE